MKTLLCIIATRGIYYAVRITSIYFGIYWNILEYRAHRNLSKEKFGSSRSAKSGINSAPLYDAFFSLRLIAQKRERCITYKTDAPKANNIRTFLRRAERRKIRVKGAREEKSKTCNAFTCAINKR